MNDFVIDFDALCKDITPSKDEEKNVEWHRKFATALIPRFHWISKQFGERLAVGSFSRLAPLVAWTSQPSQLARCWNRLFSSITSGVDSLELLLSLTPLLERSLGDLLFSLDQTTKVPALLRDLLAMQELEHLLGAACISVLRVTFGSPHSINLRNVVWHGFVFPSEISQVFVRIIFLFFGSIGEILEKKGLKMTKRQLLSISQVRQINWTNNVDDLLESEILRLAENCPIFYHQNLQTLRKILQLRSEQEFLSSCLLLLPLLETTLRRLFVLSNCCPERMLTAESSVLYTTFTEIMDSQVGGKENLVLGDVGEDILLVLQDLFVLPSGPRARDRLSHGEVGVGDSGEDLHILSDHLTTVLMVVMSRRTERAYQLPDSLLSVLDSYGDYQSAFHPFPNLARSVVTNFSLLDQLTAVEIPKEVEDEEKLTEFSVNTSTTSLCAQLIPYPGKCLHRPRAEYELACLLQRIADSLAISVERTVTNTREKLDLFRGRGMRSRQRATYLRMLERLPMAHLVMLDTNCIVGRLLLSLQVLVGEEEDRLSRVTRGLKRVLKCCENIATNVSLARNKWDEVERLSSQLRGHLSDLNNHVK